MKRLAGGASAIMWILALLVGSHMAALAQGGDRVKLDRVDASGFPENRAYVTVIDENGLPVARLAAADFELIEDGQASFPPDAVSAHSNDRAAVSVLILLDLSATMKGEPLQAARAASAGFLDQLLNEASDPDRAAFVGFGQQVDIKDLTLKADAREVPFTGDKGRLLNVVNFVEVDADTGTPLYDALYRAVKITATQVGRRAIIVMTDGRDVGSVLKDDDPITEAQRQHIPVFPIGLSNSRLDRKYLQRLAELTGGQYQEAAQPDSFVEEFGRVLTQLKVQYLLRYRSRVPQVDGQYHSLLVRVTTPHGQGFDESKFLLGQPAAPPTTVPDAPTQPPRATDVPVSMPVVAATAIPEEGGMFEDISSWTSDNILLAAGAALAVLLLVVLIVLLITLMRRRSAAGSAPAATGEELRPSWSNEEVLPSEPVWSASARSSGFEVGTPAAGGVTRTVREGGVTPAGRGRDAGEAGTWVAPTDLPVAPTPFGSPPPHEEADVEGTLVLSRGPKMKVVGFLVDRQQPGRRFDVDKATVTIGRSSGNSIAIDHATVSRQHATIKLEGDEFRLYDLGSANGTFLGDSRVREPVTLEDGALVRFGQAEFIFKQMSLE